MTEQEVNKKRKLHERQYDKIDLFIRQDIKETKDIQARFEAKEKAIKEER